MREDATHSAGSKRRARASVHGCGIQRGDRALSVGNICCCVTVERYVPPSQKVRDIRLAVAGRLSRRANLGASFPIKLLAR